MTFLFFINFKRYLELVGAVIIYERILILCSFYRPVKMPIFKIEDFQKMDLNYVMHNSNFTKSLKQRHVVKIQIIRSI